MLRPSPQVLAERAAALEADLRALGPLWWGARVRFLAEPTDVPPGSLLAWAGCAGFYVNRDPAEAWQLIGVEILAARRFVRGERAKTRHRPPPPTPSEVLGIVVEVAKFAVPAITEVIRDARTR